MPNRYKVPLFRAAAALAFALVLARCTPGGQFDPTTIFDNDMFSSKTPLKGQRIPLFPNGVPGTTTGVPSDLVKGYKPPADQADADPDAINPPPNEMAQQPAKSDAKVESKPRAKVAIGRPHGVLKPPKSTPTRIDVGAKGVPAGQDSQTNWPAPPPTGAASQPGVAWPAPPTAPAPQQATQQSQGIWPAPPPTGPAPAAAAPSTAPAAPAPSQAGQTFDSMWPKQSATSGASQ
ncbi:MAG: hypothetical protein WBD71_09745 [Xanthobacteraceae bacterium]